MSIVYILIALLAGWAIGFFDSNMRTSKKIKAAEAKAAMAVREAEERLAAAMSGSKLETSSAPGVLVFRNAAGVPSLEMDGNSIDLRAMSGEQKKRLSELLAYIRSWAEGAAAVQAPVAVIGPQPAVSPFLPPASAAGAEAKPPLSPALPAITESPKPVGVISQIDAVLQKYLVNSPLAGKEIRLVERTSSGGIQVYVGSQKYPTLADVPDPLIKAAIRAAITEWEQKHAPVPQTSAPPLSPGLQGSQLTASKPPPIARPESEKEFRSLSIVAQIDTMLQTRLENTPHAETGIRLVERTALGGVEVYVGDRKYPALDDVPDPQIKSIIRATIAEWEKKYTPG
jgi:hypothetical protein